MITRMFDYFTSITPHFTFVSWGLIIGCFNSEFFCTPNLPINPPSPPPIAPPIAAAVAPPAAAPVAIAVPQTPTESRVVAPKLAAVKPNEAKQAAVAVAVP